MMSGLRYFIFSLTVTIAFISVIIHVIGIGLLVYTQNRIHHNQKRYLIHLNIAEVLLLIFVFPMVYQLTFTQDLVILYDVFALMEMGGFSVVWVLLMVLLTIERFLEVWLNITYEVYITRRKINISVTATWMTGFIGTITVFTSKYIFNFHIKEFIHHVIYPISIGILLLIFLICYGYIYYKLYKTNKVDAEVHNGRRILRKDHHFIPFWMIINFVLFIIVPEVTISITHYIYTLNSGT